MYTQDPMLEIVVNRMRHDEVTEEAKIYRACKPRRVFDWPKVRGFQAPARLFPGVDALLVAFKLR